MTRRPRSAWPITYPSARSGRPRPARAPEEAPGSLARLPFRAMQSRSTSCPRRQDPHRRRGESLLDATRRAGLPIASACRRNGRARAAHSRSSCGAESLPASLRRESIAKERNRIDAGAAPGLSGRGPRDDLTAAYVTYRRRQGRRPMATLEPSRPTSRAILIVDHGTRARGQRTGRRARGARPRHCARTGSCEHAHMEIADPDFPRGIGLLAGGCRGDPRPALFSRRRRSRRESIPTLIERRPSVSTPRLAFRDAAPLGRATTAGRVHSNASRTRSTAESRDDVARQRGSADARRAGSGRARPARARGRCGRRPAVAAARTRSTSSTTVSSVALFWISRRLAGERDTCCDNGCRRVRDWD